MNKKGFTIVELLAVIAVISMLLILVTPTISNLAKSSNEMIRDSKIKSISGAGESFGNDYINDYQTCTNALEKEVLLSNCTVSVAYLINNGYLEGENNTDEMIDPVSKEAFDGSVLLCYDDYYITIVSQYIEKEDLESLNFKCN